MSYTTNRQPQGLSKSIESLLREGMVAELVAINDYDHFIGVTENKDVRELFHHIMEDEKRHYGMFLEALRRIDEEEEELQQEAKEHVVIKSKLKHKTDNKKKASNYDILVFIREAIKAELEAIILYDSLTEIIEDQCINKIIKDITKDEKEHVEELTRALMILDEDTYGPIE
ncbi:ferritin family protein [Clostridium sp.]|uniref:ferritin family protein n=1 Tax=Clostridium sp. TaxID=1506 RepID=UPI003464693C